MNMKRRAQLRERKKRRRIFDRMQTLLTHVPEVSDATDCVTKPTVDTTMSCPSNTKLKVTV